MLPSQTKILQVPNPILSEISRPVNQVDSGIKALARELSHQLENPYCIGIAAIQIGERVRIIGVKMGLESIIIINPVLVKSSDKIYTNIESCMSVNYGRDIYRVKRHKLVKVRGVDLNERTITYKGRDRFGAVLQHEIDHLDGRIINQFGEKWY